MHRVHPGSISKRHRTIQLPALPKQFVLLGRQLFKLPNLPHWQLHQQFHFRLPILPRLQREKFRPDKTERDLLPPQTRCGKSVHHVQHGFNTCIPRVVARVALYARDARDVLTC